MLYYGWGGGGYVPVAWDGYEFYTDPNTPSGYSGTALNQTFPASGNTYVYAVPVYIGTIPYGAPQQVQDDWNKMVSKLSRFHKIIPSVPPANPNVETSCDPRLGGNLQSCNSQPPMMEYSAHSSAASLRLQDIPLTYKVAFGPSVDIAVFYTDNASSVGGMAATNGGWRTNFDAWLQDDPTQSANAVTVFPRGGGSESYPTYDGTNTFSGNRWGTSTLVRTSVFPLAYERRFADGSKEVYGLSDNAANAPRHVYLTEIDDAWGNAVTLQYTGLQLSAITDAAGKVTSFVYDTNNPAQLDNLVDPFLRTAVLGYDGQGRLQTCTDPAGTLSTVAYGNDGKVSSLTTPYGTSQFARLQTAAGGNIVSGQILTMTDPLGGVDKIETDMIIPQPALVNDGNGSSFLVPQSAPNPSSIYNPAAMDPTDHSTLAPYTTWLNTFLSNPNPPAIQVGLWNGVWMRQMSAFDTFGASGQTTYYWDKKANMMGLTQYSNARKTGWASGAQGISGTPTWTKAPLEGPVTYIYNGQTNAGVSTDNHVIQSYRTKADGYTTTEVNGYAYTNPLGLLTQSTDPVGRTAQINYDPNSPIDVIEVRNITSGANDLLTSFGDYQNHRPKTITDAAGEQTHILYNARGQLSQITNAKNELTKFDYDETANSPSFGMLTKITKAFSDPLLASATSFGHDSYGRVHTITDSENYALTIAYDQIDANHPLNSIDRIVSITYPDTTKKQFLYDDPRWPLDVAHSIDRQNRSTAYEYDAVRHRTKVTDPLNQVTQFVYCPCGALDKIIDAANNITRWDRDLEKRPYQKTIAGQVVATYGYDPDIGLLQTITDAQSQVTTYGYYNDDKLATVTYTGSINPTPNVALFYDPAYPRLTKMTDANGDTKYDYYPIAAGNDNSGYLETISIPVYNTPNTWNTITYEYDKLGRVNNRAINGTANPLSLDYDALGRVYTETNLLGQFGYSFVDQTNRLDHVSFPGYPGNQPGIKYDWYPNAQDQRLRDISYFGLSGTAISESHYDGYYLEGAIHNWTRSWSGQSHSSQYTFGYDEDDRVRTAVLDDTTTLATLKSYGYNYDAVANRTTFTEDGVSLTATPNAFNQIGENASTNGTMLFKGTVSEPAIVTVAGVAASMNGPNWEAAVPVNTGANSLLLQATETVSQIGLTPHGTSNHINFTLDTQLGNSLAYDVDGNMFNNQGKQSYTWDAANRLIGISYTGTNQTTVFGYDGMNRVVAIYEKVGNTNTSEKHFIWEGIRVVEERDGGNNVTNQLFDQGEQRGSLSLYYMRDHLGSIRGMVDSTNSIRTLYDYDPWGQRTKLSGDLDCDLGFTGHYTHATSGLVMAPFRFYSTEFGRWLSRDPLEEEGGINLYEYAESNPVRFSDPSGLIIIPPPGCEDLYWEARRYLEQDPDMRRIFRQLDRSKRRYKIRINCNGDDGFDWLTGIIDWDPFSMLMTTGGGMQSPALGFGHEADHAAGSDANFNGFWQRSHQNDPQYGDAEEKRVITGAEASAAGTLGEDSRSDHQGTGVPGTGVTDHHYPD